MLGGREVCRLFADGVQACLATRHWPEVYAGNWLHPSFSRTYISHDLVSRRFRSYITHDYTTSFPGSFLYAKTRRKDPGWSWSRVTRISRGKFELISGRGAREVACRKRKFSKYCSIVFLLQLIIIYCQICV